MDQHFWLRENMVDDRIQDRLREAEVQRLLRHAGVAQRGWPARQAAWAVRQVGVLLVVLGQWLQQYGPSQPLPAADCVIAANPGCQAAQ